MLFVVQQRQPSLFVVVRALSAPRSFAGRLHGGQEQRDEDCYDGNHHQEFDECKTMYRMIGFPFHAFTRVYYGLSNGTL